MSEHVWVSRAITDPALVARVKTDIGARDKAAIHEAGKLLDRGQPVPQSMCPQRIWVTEDPSAANPDPKPIAPILNLFLAGRYWIVSAEAAEIIGRFDLGGGALYPVSEGVFEYGNETRIPGDFFTWVFGNSKQAFLAAETINKRKFGTGAGDIWNLPWELADGDIVVSQAALVGPDVWLDDHLFESIFLSGLLGDALGAAALSADFRLFRCKVI